jgi:hypothetical protein
MTQSTIMGQTITVAAEPATETNPRTFSAGILVMSFASLLLELALTRLFSVILFYHFAFLAISIALLGLGAGGVFAYLARAWLLRWSTRGLGAAICAINAVVIVAVLETVLHVPVSLTLSAHNFLWLTVIYLAAAVPFLFTGLLFSIVFARATRHITRLYGADLSGGALACLAIVPLLNFLGGPNAVLFSALAMAAAAAIWAQRKRQWAIVLAVALAAVIAGNHSGKLVDIVYAKGMRRDRPWQEYARWNAISRVEVDDQGANGKYIVIDADASTALMHDDPARPPSWDVMNAPSATVNVLRPHGAYAIIGPGGGVDVLRAVLAGSPSVTGIEINPIIVDRIMRGRYAEYSHHLYELPQVHIHVSDGRSWIRSSRDQFDVIQMTLVDTWASTAAGAFALSENNLYTTEAFREYFAHLKPDGMLAITRWEFRQPREALRVVSQAMAALRSLGVQDLAQHFVVICDGPLNTDGRPVTVLAKRAPFTADELGIISGYMVRYRGLQLLYAPLPNGSGSSFGGDPSGAFERLIASGAPRHFAATYAYDVAPVSDNAPFFFFTFKTGQAVDRVLAGGSAGMDWKVNLGVVVLGMVLVISVLAVLAFLIVPLAAHAPARCAGVLRLCYFVAIGLGYILVEIALIQRFVLFLGHPTYALTVVVFLLLLASGAGSLVSRRWLGEPLRVRLPLTLIAIALAVYVLRLPPMLTSLVGLPFAVKLLLSATVLAPLGFAMGMPFPSGLRLLTATPSRAKSARDGDPGAGESTVEWAWAMNAAASVLGSVLAMVIALHFGLNATLACGAAAYLAALALVGRVRAANRVIA